MGSKEDKSGRTSENEPIKQIMLADVLTEYERPEHIDAIPTGLNNVINVISHVVISETGYKPDSRFGKFIFLTASANVLAGQIIRDMRRHTVHKGIMKGDLTETGKELIGSLQALQADIHATRREIGNKIFGDKAEAYFTEVNTLLLYPTGGGGYDTVGQRKEKYKAFGARIRNSYPLTSR